MQMTGDRSMGHGAAAGQMEPAIADVRKPATQCCHHNHSGIFYAPHCINLLNIAIFGGWSEYLMPWSMQCYITGPVHQL